MFNAQISKPKSIPDAEKSSNSTVASRSHRESNKPVPMTGSVANCQHLMRRSRQQQIGHSDADQMPAPVWRCPSLAVADFHCHLRKRRLATCKRGGKNHCRTLFCCCYKSHNGGSVALAWFKVSDTTTIAISYLGYCSHWLLLLLRYCPTMPSSEWRQTSLASHQGVRV